MSDGWVPEIGPTDDMSAEERQRLVASMRPEDAEPVPELHEVDVPDELKERIEAAMAKYPEVRSASLPALWAVQRHYGWCTPDGIRQAAAVMGVTPGYLESVATFYDLFRTGPVGRHHVLVCHNLACWLRGSEDVLDAFCEAAGVDPNEVDHIGASSEDGEVYLKAFECLGACDIAPMASIDGYYRGPLTRSDAAQIVEELRSGRSSKEVLPEKSYEGDYARRLTEREAAEGQPDEGTEER